MSHHLDTPLARQNGQLYIDDLCVFDAGESTVFVMDVNSTITEAHVQPGFHHEARYEFKVHFDGAEFETLTYRVSFGEIESNDGRQPLRLHVLTDEEAHEDGAVGQLVLEGRTGEPVSGEHVRVWAGRITDWFYIDLSLLFKINAAVKDGTVPDLSEWRPESAQNSFAEHDRRVNRARGLSPASEAPPWRPHRRLVRDQARDRRRWLAADQPRRPPDDVADLLAGRHAVREPRQHPSPVRGPRRRQPVHRRSDRCCRGGDGDIG